MEILKISSKSNPNSVAGAIAGLVKEVDRAEMQAIPAFAEVEVEGEDRTGIKLIVESRK